jgi:hypothetical protein
MIGSIEKAKQILLQENATCVICGEDVFVSHERGIAPLLSLYESGKSFVGCFAADKVVGRGAAFVYVLLGVSEIYAAVVSKPAMQVLESHGIKLSYGICVEAIQNRTGDGFCPMEQAVRDIDDPEKALLALKSRLAELSAK